MNPNSLSARIDRRLNKWHNNKMKAPKRILVADDEGVATKDTGSDSVASGNVPVSALNAKRISLPLNASATNRNFPQKSTVAFYTEVATLPTRIAGTPANEQILKAPSRVLKVEMSDEKTAEITIKSDGLILIETGMIFNINGTEMLCTAVGENDAVIRSGMKSDDRTRLLGNKTKASRIIRRVSHEIVQQFLAGETGAGLNKKPTIPGEESNTMKTKNKTKAPKKSSGVKKTSATQSFAGRPVYIEKLIADGKTNVEIVEMCKVKFPGSSKSNVLKCADKKRKAAKKSPAKKAVVPAKAPAKAPVKKAAPKKKVVAPAAPAKPAVESPVATPSQAEGEVIEATAA